MLYEVRKRTMLTVEAGSRVMVTPEQYRTAQGYLVPAMSDGGEVNPDDLRVYVEGAVADRTAELIAEHEKRLAAVIADKDAEIDALTAENASLKVQIGLPTSDGANELSSPVLSAMPEAVYRMMFGKLTLTELIPVATNMGVDVPEGARKPEVVEILLKRVV